MICHDDSRHLRSLLLKRLPKPRCERAPSLRLEPVLCALGFSAISDELRPLLTGGQIFLRVAIVYGLAVVEMLKRRGHAGKARTETDEWKSVCLDGDGWVRPRSQL